MTDATRVPAVILAGGQARRMGGGDKGLLRLGDRTILDHVVTALTPQAGPLALNANGDPARFAEFALPVLADEDDERPGPLAGILAGMEWAAGLGAASVVTAAADTPFLPADLVARLIADTGPGGLCLAATREGGRIVRHPTVGLWPVTLRHDLRAALAGGVRKIVLWTDRHGAASIVFDEPGAFFNVNTPEDLIAAGRLLEGRR